MIAEKNETWNEANMRDFWAEMAPTDHLVQVYENDKVFLNTLEGFVGSGLLAGESVIVIATLSHINELNVRLSAQGLNIAKLVSTGQYVPEDAHEILSRFMVNNWPDDKLFVETVSALFQKAKGRNGRRVRAFGEMVAILWEKGNAGATVQLEHLWNRLCARSAFCLFCAYPKSGFTQDPGQAMQQICCLHSKILDGRPRASTEVYFRPATSSY
jgi:hypothetical protein